MSLWWWVIYIYYVNSCNFFANLSITSFSPKNSGAATKANEVHSNEPHYHCKCLFNVSFFLEIVVTSSLKVMAKRKPHPPLLLA